MYITPLLDMFTQHVRNLSIKYAKTILYRIENHERLKKLDPTTRTEIRKIVLDCLNDLHREFSEYVDKKDSAL